ncbi:MAG TPA: substrate-binding domain-containing protein [Bryobacteraceae bacterium]|nr:substrate-binding domain-containing protein [Bryobacteraceae bacterium]
MHNSRTTRREVFTAIAALGLAACNRSTKRTIAVIPKGTSSVFWIAVEAGARAAGKEFDVEILWNGAPLETEYSRQIQIVDSMVARHVDGIALAAAERKALVAPFDRAIAAGIPVTVFDSGLDSTNYLSYVATDNVEAGRLAARTLAGLLGAKGIVAMIMHAPGSASTMDREKGFIEVMAKEFPGMRIAASQFGSGDRAKSMSVTENILTAHPELNGVFASSEPSSVGAAHAIKARGLSGKLKFVSFDSSEGLIEDLRGGTIDAMIVQDPFKMGYEAVRTVVDKLHGKTPPKRLDLSARVVTKSDLDKPEIKKLLNLPA